MVARTLQVPVGARRRRDPGEAAARDIRPTPSEPGRAAAAQGHIAMKVLVADKFEKSGVEGLKALGCEIVHEPDLKDDTLKDALAATGADVLVVRSTVVTEPMLDAGRLSLIVRAGAGYNTIDVKAAS